MPVQIGNLLKLLAEKAGLNENDKPVADLLSINAQVGDEFYNTVKNTLDSLLTMEGAKGNPTLEAYFRSRNFLPLDSEIKKLTDELGFNEEQKAEFESEKSTYKKVRRLAELARDNELKKATLLQTDKDGLQGELSRMNELLQTERQAWEEKIKSTETQAAAQMLDNAIEFELRQRNYADNIPEALRVSGAKELLQKELAAKKLAVNRSGGNQLQLLNNDTSAFAENDREVPFGDFVDKLLAAHAMLKVSDSAARPNVTPIIKINTADAKSGTSGIISANEQQIKLLERSW